MAINDTTMWESIGTIADSIGIGGTALGIAVPYIVIIIGLARFYTKETSEMVDYVLLFSFIGIFLMGNFFLAYSIITFIIAVILKLLNVGINKKEQKT